MYGPGPVPPQGGTPTHVVVLRVLFAVLPLLSCGMLAAGALLRLALVTRRPRDWWLFGASVIVTIVGIAFIPEDTETLQADLSVGGLLLHAALVTGYFLYADIRHFDRRPHGPAALAGPSPYAGTVPSAGLGYGYPAAHGRTPYPATPAAPTPYGQLTPPAQVPPRAPAPPHVPPVPAPQQGAAPAAPRIDQVRAELDELSDLLRKEEGGR
ncbi:hypothetical protein [Streptomyces rubrolavendulae]|uniref:IgA FC receptor n=1 Tax=Streptomyces rubrolavendulae TaxID=285473 RepID=A0A1D8G1I1_9ACTN|nr:hypothetical protein [Streptomyces rubrolavendulae]AOT59295.1 hypothetical protein A4G23_02132 [Streptomyces rubrolavendulae]